MKEEYSKHCVHYIPRTFLVIHGKRYVYYINLLYIPSFISLSDLCIY